MSIAFNKDEKNIDLIIIVHNEEKNILNIVNKTYYDNLIILDSVSDDTTIEKLKLFKNKLYFKRQ